jgi:hypothetical protein
MQFFFFQNSFSIVDAITGTFFNFQKKLPYTGTSTGTVPMCISCWLNFFSSLLPKFPKRLSENTYMVPVCKFRRRFISNNTGTDFFACTSPVVKLVNGFYHSFFPTRTLGESYAAAWTAKHSEQALKAEPPDSWPATPSSLDAGGGGGWRQDTAAVKTEPGGEYARSDLNTSAAAAKQALDDYGRSKANENNNFSAGSADAIIKKEAAGDYFSAAAISPRTTAAADPMIERHQMRQTTAELMDVGKQPPSARGGGGGYRRSLSRDRSSPGGYSYGRRSRDGSIERAHHRYRSSSREDSREPPSYRRRSYEGSLGDPYHPRSRDLSPERDRYRHGLILKRLHSYFELNTVPVPMLICYRYWKKGEVS